jgi:hypothetical protein
MTLAIVVLPVCSVCCSIGRRFIGLASYHDQMPLRIPNIMFSSSNIVSEKDSDWKVQVMTVKLAARHGTCDEAHLLFA